MASRGKQVPDRTYLHYHSSLLSTGVRSAVYVGGLEGDTWLTTLNEMVWFYIHIMVTYINNIFHIPNIHNPLSWCAACLVKERPILM